MEADEAFNENRDLSSYVKFRRKVFWVRRFIVLKSSILYYYKNATATVPRGIFHLQGSTVTKDPKDLVLDISKPNSFSLKIELLSATDFQVWFNYLTLSSKTSDKQTPHPCAYTELQKVSEKENNSLIEQIPKTSLQSYNTKIREIIDKEYKITGTRGSSVYAVYNSENQEGVFNKPKRKFEILYLLITLELIRYLFGSIFALVFGIFYLSYKFLKKSPNNTKAIHSRTQFRCTALVGSGTGEILTALHDTLCRLAWEPYLIDCNESTTIKLTYKHGLETLTQEISRVFIKDSLNFYVLEKSGTEIKNLFKIENKNKRGETQSFVSHYGCVSGNENPLIGNSDILSCLKLYVESTTIYVSQSELHNTQFLESEEDDLTGSVIGLNDVDKDFPFSSEANRVLKEAEALLDEKEGWEDLKLKSRFVKGSRRKAAGGLYVIKGEGEINRSINEVVDALKDINKKGGYDSMFESGNIVETINESSEIVYQKYKGKAGVSPRDFCLLQKRFEMADGKVVAVATSVLHSKCPETKFVRAQLFMGCHFLTPTGPNSTMDVYMIYVDVKGSVPKFIINSVQNDQAMLVDNLRNYLS